MKKLMLWIINLFTGFQKAYENFKPTAEKVVQFINTLKSGIESGTLDSLAAITPSAKDDLLVVKIKEAVGNTAKEMAFAENIIINEQSGASALSILGNHIAQKSKSARLKFWVELAGKIMVVVVADGKLTIAEAIALTQLVYSGLKNNN